MVTPCATQLCTIHYTINVTHLKWAIQWFSAHSQGCTTVTPGDFQKVAHTHHPPSPANTLSSLGLWLPLALDSSCKWGRTLRVTHSSAFCVWFLHLAQPPWLAVAEPGPMHRSSLWLGSVQNSCRFVYPLTSPTCSRDERHPGPRMQDLMWPGISFLFVCQDCCVLWSLRFSFLELCPLVLSAAAH
jgi:hypothetical protein